MDEQQLEQMYSFFTDEGYNVGDMENFRTALSDDNRRKQMYDFFTSEGYNVGNFDNFVYRAPRPVVETRQPLTADWQTPPVR